MTIYSPIPITQQIRQTFKPCRLYVKELAGVKYFGKTSRDPYAYSGSGIIWRDRIKKYGKENIKTLWVSKWYYDPQTIHDDALQFSMQNKIVESNEWANLQAENGIAGGRFINPGRKGSGIKSAITKRLKGIPAGGTKESIRKGNITKMVKGIDIVRQLNTPLAKEKAKRKCRALANRTNVNELRVLSRRLNVVLGSGWVRKPDHWILEMIQKLNNRIY